MSLGDFLEKFGRTVLEGPMATRSAEPPELAEIRLAVLDHVREKSYRSGGRKVFPFDLVKLRLRGVEDGRREVFTGQFFRRYLEQEVRNALRDNGCKYPENLRVDVAAEAVLPERDEDWLIVEAASQDRTGTRTAARLVVREGTANRAVLPLDKARIHVGRVVDVYRNEGLFRRNDLAFEQDTEINRTVSREHAHIRFDRATGEYRLFNDRWQPRGSAAECGTWIMRDGISQPVHRTSRGVKLEPGDEIRFGRAVVVFEEG